jgi:hypothetical protein
MVKGESSKIIATRSLQIDFECDRLLCGLLAEFFFGVAFVKPPGENYTCVMRKFVQASQAEAVMHQSELPARRGMKNAEAITTWISFGSVAVCYGHFGGVI